MSKLKKSLIFTIPALLLLAVAFSQSTATAQSSNCTVPYLIDITLPTGTNWSFCWEERLNEGIVLREIRFTPPGAQSLKVLYQANLAQIHVPYDDNGARFHDLSDYGLGGGNLLNLTLADCPDGTLLEHNGKKVLCMITQTRGQAFKYYGEQLQGYMLKLFSISAVGEYNYIVEWNFYDDGTIEPAVTATGKLQRLGSNSDYGWPLNDDNSQIGISHTHNYYWRLDFDLFNEHNDTVEKIEFNQSTDQKEFTISQSKISTEEGQQVQPTSFRSWRVMDELVTNDDGHPISYQLEAEPSHLFRGPSFEPWTHNELYVTHYQDCEMWVSHNPTTGGCGSNVTEFLNGESVFNNDIVVWYGQAFHHLPREEDQSHMHAHTNSFKMTPRDWTASNPLVGVTPVNTATPVPSPTPPTQAEGTFCHSTAVGIPDNGTTSTTLTITDAGTIADLDVSLDVQHTFIGDLTFTLTHDDTGTSATIYDQPGVPPSQFGCNGNDINVILDDEASLPVEDACGPTISGTYIPNQLLSAFDGESITGDWTLTMTDNAADDTGTLNEFCLITQ